MQNLVPTNASYTLTLIYCLVESRLSQISRKEHLELPNILFECIFRVLLQPFLVPDLILVTVYIQQPLVDTLLILDNAIQKLALKFFTF